jgi:hypothetical protein
MVRYSASLEEDLSNDLMRSMPVWHIGDEGRLEQAELCMHANGFLLKPKGPRAPMSFSLSPFSTAMAYHSNQVKASHPNLSFFKISLFQFNFAMVFAAEGADASGDRARWIAEIARSIRMITLSLFPPFNINTQPLPWAASTSNRLLAGYLLFCDFQKDQSVSVIYCELRASVDKDSSPIFAGYEDDCCENQVLSHNITIKTCTAEQAGVDCSCFYIGPYQVSARTCEEKKLWLRALSNLKMKLQCGSSVMTSEELTCYRGAILSQSQKIRVQDANCRNRKPMLPRLRPTDRKQH